MKLPTEDPVILNGSITQNDITMAALDAVFGSDEQTYDEFIANFIHYHPDESSSSVNVHPVSPHVQCNRNSTTTVSPAELSIRDENNDDDLEVEVLEEGIVRQASLEDRPPSRLQFDNFVLDDDVDSGYVASFDDSAKTTSDEIVSEPIDVETAHTPDCDERWPLNPGEIASEEVPEMLLKGKIRVENHGVNYRIKTMEECLEDSKSAIPSSDTIEPFSLDEDFDYDNVALSPKFNQDEMNYLKACAAASTDED